MRRTLTAPARNFGNAAQEVGTGRVTQSQHAENLNHLSSLRAKQSRAVWAALDCFAQFILNACKAVEGLAMTNDSGCLQFALKH